MNRAYGYIFLCALVWGSSFILMKKGLDAFSAMQVGALRMAVAGLVFLPIVLYRLSQRKRKLPVAKLMFSTTIGNLIPAFLFPLAQTQLESGTTGVLNSLTPLFTLLLGMLLFGTAFRWNKVLGVGLGLQGAALLVLQGEEVGGDASYALLVVIATVLYGFNTNYVKYKLGELSALDVTSFGLGLAAVPALLYLLLGTNFAEVMSAHPQAMNSLWAVIALGAVGTSLALLLFFQALKIASPVAAASVTYLIPIVALGWAVADGEALLLIHFAGLAAILLGVWLVNRRYGRK